MSRRESDLIDRINRGLPADLVERYARLVQRRKRGRLKPKEHEELLHLTAEAESRDVDRTAALVELAKVRRVPVRVLVLGLTPIGRATVESLRLNREALVNLRRLLVGAGEHPP